MPQDLANIDTYCDESTRISPVLQHWGPFLYYVIAHFWTFLRPTLYVSENTVLNVIPFLNPTNHSPTQLFC